MVCKVSSFAKWNLCWGTKDNRYCRDIAKTVKLIREKSDKNILFIGGGIIPEKDIPKLKESGIVHIVGPGTPIPEIINFIKTNLEISSNDSRD